MAPPRTVVTTSSCSLLLIYRTRKDERLSWPGWLTYSERFTHMIRGHPSAVDRAQDSESSPVKDQRSTAKPRNQPRRGSMSPSKHPNLALCLQQFLYQFQHRVLFLVACLWRRLLPLPQYGKTVRMYRQCVEMHVIKFACWQLPVMGVRRGLLSQAPLVTNALRFRGGGVNSIWFALPLPNQFFDSSISPPIIHVLIGRSRNTHRSTGIEYG